MKDTRANVCVCSHHENFRFKIESLYFLDKDAFIEFQNLQKFESFLVCDQSTNDCYLSKCLQCKNRPKIVNLIRTLNDDQKLSNVSWFVWKLTDKNGFKQVIKVGQEGTVEELLYTIIEASQLYLNHIYVQRAHVKKFNEDKKAALKENSEIAVLQGDWAENFRCFEQNATQAGHYGYSLVMFK